ncbi:hypothetical protein [Kribbella sp. NPDC004875]|uniref:hypothetical protein n=1 Tax=Kribbella sp. NPDC004875 TaxID=3364107 RepID=UPI00368806F7
MIWIIAAAAVAVLLTGPISLVLLVATVIAFRGCPTCWVVGLVETISRGRLQRHVDQSRLGCLPHQCPGRTRCRRRGTLPNPIQSSAPGGT